MKYHLKSSISVLALTAALGATTASAADLPVKYEPIVPYTTWTGFYVGANIGQAWDNASANVTSPAFAPPPATANPQIGSSGFIVGAHAGYNYEFNNNIVVGVEADVSGLPWMKNHLAGNATKGAIASQLSGLASIRGRLGYAFGRTLLYGTGGWGWIGENYQEISGAKGTVNSFSSNFGVPVVGAGVEYKVSSNLTAGVEGLVYFNSGSSNFTSSTGRVYAFTSGNVSVVRAKVSYNW